MVGVGVGIVAVSLLRKVVGGISSSISGLTENPAVGTTAQLGTTLTAIVSNAPQGATITYAWKEGTTTRGTGSTFVVTGVADLSNLTMVATVNGTEYPAGPYPVTRVPPTATGTLSDLTAVQGSGAQTVNVASVFSGTGLTYSMASNAIGVTINATTGVASIPFSTVFAATTVTYTATNSGGTATRTQVITSTESVAQNITVAISGLTNNPTWGMSAQYGTTLTASVTGLVGGETVTYEWREGTVSRASGSTLALVAGGDFGDNQSLTLAVIVNGTEYTDGPYTIRHAPPTALGSLADVTGTEGDASRSLDIAALFSGSALTFRVDTNSVGATIDLSTGQATQQFNVPFTATTVTYRARNSGGEVARAHTVTCNAITITPFVHEMNALIQSTAATFPASGTLATVTGATGTIIAVDARDATTFGVTVNGVAASQIGQFLNYNSTAVLKSALSLFYVPEGNGAWQISRLSGSGTLSVQAHAWRVSGGTMRSFNVVTQASATDSIKNLTQPVTWRNGDMVISTMMNDRSHGIGPGTWTLDADFTQTSGNVEAYIQSQKQTSDGGATLTYNSVVSKNGVTWVILTASQYPAVIATPNEPLINNYLYPLNAARTSVTIPVSGTYTGASADIYERVVNASGTEIVPWTLVQSGATGNAYSGSLTVPASGLNALYREARKGTDASTVRRQFNNFQVGLLFLASGQSNLGVFAEKRDVPPTLNARALSYEAQAGKFFTSANIGNGAATLLNELVARYSLPCLLVYASAAGSPIQYLAPGHVTGTGEKNVYDSIRDALLAFPPTSKIQKMFWMHGENEANAVTQKTVSQYGEILVNQIQSGYAAALGQTINDFPIVMTSLATFGGGEGASANYSYRWGYWQGIQKAIHASWPTAWLGAYAHDMVRDSSYHYYGKSTEILAKRLADFAYKLEAGGTQNPWAIASATATSATTTRVTLAHSLGTDFSVVTLPHETGTTTPQAGTIIRGFAVSADAWGTSQPCTAVKVDATTIDLTHASISTTNRKLRYAWGLQGQTGQTPPDVSEGLIVDNSAFAVPLAFETNFSVT